MIKHTRFRAAAAIILAAAVPTAFADGNSGTLPPGNYAWLTGSGPSHLHQTVNATMDLGACNNCQAPINLANATHLESLGVAQDYNLNLTGSPAASGSTTNPNLVQPGSILTVQDMGPVKGIQNLNYSSNGCNNCLPPINAATATGVADVNLIQTYNFDLGSPQHPATTHAATPVSKHNLD